MEVLRAFWILLINIIFATKSLASEVEIKLTNDTNYAILSPPRFNSKILIQDAKSCDYVTMLKQSVHTTEQFMVSMQEYLTIAKMKMEMTKLVPTSCADIKKQLPLSKNGIYPIRPRYYNDFLNVYCDMDTTTGGWTVIQKRTDIDGEQENFSRSWDDYKAGFGDLNGEFWLGNDVIFALTNQNHTELRVDMEDFDGAKRYALYTTFNVASEVNEYKLRVQGYQGDAGDSFSGHNDAVFHTLDRDRTDQKCVQLFKGGWWYYTCHKANLNGLYLRGNHSSYADGINWFDFKGHNYSLRRVEMKVRPKLFS